MDNQKESFLGKLHRKGVEQKDKSFFQNISEAFKKGAAEGKRLKAEGRGTAATLTIQKICAFVISLFVLPAFFGFPAVVMGTWFAPVFYILFAFPTGGLNCVLLAPLDILFVIIANEKSMKKVYNGSWQSRIIPPSLLFIFTQSPEEKAEREAAAKKEDKDD